MARDRLRFLRPGGLVELSQVQPDETLLDYLRLREGRCGTKEGCAEGDCGACTVVLGMARGSAVHFEAVNSCIQFLAMVDGKLVITVEDLAGAGGELHPVQEALVQHHGSQCGFCTPGFVMSMFTLYHSGAAASRARVNDWLAGNLCRCTGYRPIADAALTSCTGVATDAFARRAGELAEELEALNGNDHLHLGDAVRFFAAPATLDELARVYSTHPDATLVAGATDVGLWRTKALRELPKVVHLGRVQELKRIEYAEAQLRIGAAVTYAEAEVALGALDPDLGELLRRLGSRQVRAVGTLVGNIANGSPVGDMPPVLMALGASIELRHGDHLRSIPLEDFFLDYARQDRRDGELITRVLIPLLTASHRLRCYKVSKRFDQDISAVMGAFCFTVDDARILDARIAFGGMAATPSRARHAESAVRGLSLARAASGPWADVTAALTLDFQPIDDLRASAAYRMEVARALMQKALMEVAGVSTRTTRLVGQREPVH